MTRSGIMKRYKCSNADAAIIERIVPVGQWNKENPDMKLKYKSGYVMPVYNGYVYRSKKMQLIRKFAYIGI